MAIVQTGSVLQFTGLGPGNTGTVSSTITVPADAEFVIVGWSSYSGSSAFFSGGGMTFTKGGVDTAMTYAGGDNGSAGWSGPCFYMVLPDTGSNKTLKWDWAGTGTASDASTLCSVTFWKGVDTASPVRATGSGASSSNTPYTTGSIAGSSGDLAVAWVGGFVGAEGTIDSWSNLTLLTQIARFNSADGAWATGNPTGSSTYAASTDTNFDDGTITVVILKPAATGGSVKQVLIVKRQAVVRASYW